MKKKLLKNLVVTGFFTKFASDLTTITKNIKLWRIELHWLI